MINDSGTSFAQEWANLTGGTARAVVDGTTYYKNINTMPIWNATGLLDKLIAKESRDKNGFSLTGSVNAPVASKGVKWKDFYPQRY